MLVMGFLMKKRIPLTHIHDWYFAEGQCQICPYSLEFECGQERRHAEMKKFQLLTVCEDFSTSGPFNVGTFD